MASMNAVRLLPLAAAFLAPTPCRAEALYLFGHVGPASVLAIVEQKDASLNGWYTYLDNGGLVRLEGAIGAAGAFRLEEFAAGANTGRFAGEKRTDKWSGTWSKPDGTSPLPFALAEAPAAAAALDGAYRCTMTQVDKKYGWTYVHALKLSAARGVMTRFEASLDETSTEGEKQGCAYSLDDFRQMQGSPGVVLTAKDEPASDEGAPSCTIRLVADADHVFIRFGDLARAGDDCRFSGSTAFCSPRSFMPDLVVNRRTQACRAIGGL